MEGTKGQRFVQTNNCAQTLLSVVHYYTLRKHTYGED